MAIMKRLICKLYCWDNDNWSDCDYGVVDMTPYLALELLKYEEAVRLLAPQFSDFARVIFHGCHCEFGEHSLVDETLDEDHGERDYGDWYDLLPNDRFSRGRTDGETTIVNAEGVGWRCNPNHSNTTLETATLPWIYIARFAAIEDSDDS